jgi:hypothetical protein
MATEFILMGQILTLVGGIKNAIQEFETKKNGRENETMTLSA